MLTINSNERLSQTELRLRLRRGCLVLTDKHLAPRIATNKPFQVCKLATVLLPIDTCSEAKGLMVIFISLITTQIRVQLANSTKA